jgi:hypothetical protein
VDVFFFEFLRLFLAFLSLCIVPSTTPLFEAPLSISWVPPRCFAQPRPRIQMQFIPRNVPEFNIVCHGSVRVLSQIKSHLFFKGLDWERALRRDYDPPFHPCRPKKVLACPPPWPPKRPFILRRAPLSS